MIDPNLATQCVFCERPFELGDRGSVMGHMQGPMWVHTVCLLREVVGDEAADDWLESQA